MRRATLSTSSSPLTFERECPPHAAGAAPSPPRWRLALAAMFNPGSLIQQQLSGVRWPLTLVVPGLAFALLFLQTGLDRMRVGTAAWTAALFFPLVGVLYGTLGVTMIALVGWVGLKVLGGKESPAAVIRAFALTYSPALVYVVLGLFANVLFGWRTAVAFGVTGVLWALGPMITTLRQMTGQKTAASVVLAVLCGSLLLLGWSVIGGI